jgi:hypothetical protein
MPQSFYARLKQYYIKIGAVLRGEADAASIFPNTTDVGISRENVYVEFLKMHLPYWKRPNIIHVAGKYNIVRVGKEGGKMRDGTELPAHAFIAQSDSTDVYALSYATVHIQQNAVMV